MPVPAQVADKLRGRTFSSFDSFRRAFWIAVSQAPELAKQLNNASLGQTKLGKSTFVKKGERAGKRLKHELHHKKSIQDGGEV
ncbi:HNH endonuclease [Enterobacter roggenkampii]|nr:HNH endonuclease [Enterobacter roggenkampii]